MIRFMLRLVGALLVEEICERIRPAQWELAPLGKPDGWLRYKPTVYIPPVTTTVSIADTMTYTAWPGWIPTRTGTATVTYTVAD